MTEVTRTIRRKTAASKYSKGHVRNIILVIEPPGTRIGFRLAKSRTTYYLPTGDLLCMAIRVHTAAERDRKKAERKARRR